MCKFLGSGCLSLGLLLGIWLLSTTQTAAAKAGKPVKVGEVGQAKNWFLPENTLHLQSPGPTNAMTKETFDGIIKQVTDRFCPIFESYGVICDVTGDWESTIVNAYAMRGSGAWTIALFGGLARRPELTNDGFAIVVCHEMGHHISGFAFKTFVLGDDWASTEGQSDYFAAHACLPEIWGAERETNARYRNNVDPVVKRGCDAVWKTTERQNLCYRIGAAIQSETRMIARATGRGPDPRFERPSAAVVSETYEAHPDPQCRMDTQLGGALCPLEFDFGRIPGEGLGESNRSLAAERDSTQTTCHQSMGYALGARPRCWFFPRSIQ
jgi:hypothetical protein